MTLTDAPPANEVEVKLKALSDEAATIVERADSETRDINPEEQARIKAIFEEAKSIRGAARKASQREGLLDQIKGLITPDEARELNKAAVKPTTPERGKAKTLYDRWADDPAIKSFYASHPDGFSESVRVHTPPVRMPGLKGLQTSDVVDPLLRPDWMGMLDPFYQQPLVIRSVLTIGSTQTDTIEYARMESVENNAAVVPEATDVTPGGTSGIKPMSNMAFEKVSTSVKTIAHWMAATKRALADAGQLRTLINEFLVYGLNEVLEEEIINGDGTGEHFLGLLNTPGILAQPFDTDMLATIRKAITQVQITGRTQPNALLINPADDEAFDLLKGGDGNYLMGNSVPWVSGQPRTVWGVTRVVSENIPQGTALLGNFRFAVLWDRETATLTATDSHDNFFIRNLMAILAELRAAFGVLRPQAFVEIALAAPPSP